MGGIFLETTSPVASRVTAVVSAEKVWDSRYLMVNAWRGLAALGVVLYHIGFPFGFNMGHACVLLFFVISGYCISASTDSCVRNNVGPKGYMWRRVRRIYPPYFLAICFFVVTRLWKLEMGDGNQLSQPVLVWIQNLTLTQWLTLVRHPDMYSYFNHSLFVAAFWSLDYEEQFYIVMGIILFAAIFFRKSMVVGIVALMVPAFIWNVSHPSMSYGFFLEYWIAFALGALVFFRLCKVTSLYGRLGIDLTFCFFVIFSIYRSGPTHLFSTARTVYNEWFLTSAFALLLIIARPLDRWFKNSWIGWALCGLGLISYSLYLTHQFNLHLASMVARRLVRLGIPQILDFPIQLMFICGIATIFWHFCERPFLNKPLSGRSADAPNG